VFMLCAHKTLATQHVLTADRALYNLRHLFAFHPPLSCCASSTATTLSLFSCCAYSIAKTLVLFMLCLQYRQNTSTPIFDARRPPLKAGSLSYHASQCKDVPAAAREGAHAGHYNTCAAGAACGSAHSLVETLYNPEQFKRQRCQGVVGGKCVNCEAGA
jgi:hypothetical protein